MPKQRFSKKDSVEIAIQQDYNIKTKARKFKFTDKQQRLLKLLLDKDSPIVFISGPAGSSKSFMAVYAAIQMMVEDKEKDLIYVRSIIESADKGLGSLPGDISEKFDPFLMPLYDKLDEILPPQETIYLKNQKKISAIPINFLRGASWVNKIVIADECQNFTLKELTTLITRIGHNSKLIICGDYMQSDINGRSGFKPMIKIFSDEESKEKGIHTFSFGHDDIVRSEILKFITAKIEEAQNKV